MDHCRRLLRLPAPTPARSVTVVMTGTSETGTSETGAVLREYGRGRRL
jgi:hypothetical protein